MIARERYSAINMFRTAPIYPDFQHLLLQQPLLAAEAEDPQLSQAYILQRLRAVQYAESAFAVVAQPATEFFCGDAFEVLCESPDDNITGACDTSINRWIYAVAASVSFAVTLPLAAVAGACGCVVGCAADMCCCERDEAVQQQEAPSRQRMV